MCWPEQSESRSKLTGLQDFQRGMLEPTPLVELVHTPRPLVEYSPLVVPLVQVAPLVDWSLDVDLSPGWHFHEEER